jgi:hypothetical protein
MWNLSESARVYVTFELDSVCFEHVKHATKLELVPLTTKRTEPYIDGLHGDVAQLTPSEMILAKA